MKNLKKIMGICFAVIFILFVMNACGVLGIEFTIGDAQAQFIAWIGTQAAEPQSVGFYLGEVNQGDIISSFAPASLPEEASPRASGNLPEAGWLFYVDEWPGSFYNHPGKILVIGKSGQNLYSENTQGWPTVNGEKPGVLNQEYQVILSDVTKAVYNPWNVYIPIQVIRWPGVVFQLARYGAVVVNGLTPTQNLYTEASNAHEMMVDAMQDLMNGGGIYDHVRSVDYPSNTPTELAAAVADLVNNFKITNITVYFIAHGNIEYMNIGGTGYHAHYLKTLFEEFPNVKFTLIVETCHGGSWKDYFQNLVPVLGNLQMVIASTSAADGAYPDWDNASGLTDFNAAQDVWVEWTSDFILQLEYYTDAANWPTVTGLTTPAFTNNKLKLYYLSFMTAKTTNPNANSLTFTERTPIDIQEPGIWYP